MKKIFAVSTVCLLILGLFSYQKSENNSSSKYTKNASEKITSQEKLTSTLVKAHSDSSMGSAPISAEIRALKTWLSEESFAMDRVQDNPELISQRLQIKAKNLSMAEAKELSKIAADSNQKHNMRSLAVYLLTQNPARFSKELLSILDRDVDFAKLEKTPHSIREVLRQTEYTLSLQVLQSLEALAIKDTFVLEALDVTAARNNDALTKNNISLSVAAARKGQVYWTTKYNELISSVSTN